MTENEIIEGNKLIAEFDGWKFIRMVQGGLLPFWQKFKDGKLIHDGIFHDPDYMKWESIMPIVEKIDTLVIKTNITSNIVTIRIEEDSLYDIVILFRKEGFSKLEGIWIAVIEFIKWLNNQNKTQ